MSSLAHSGTATRAALVPESFTADAPPDSDAWVVELGGKGASLQHLASADLPVPSFMVVTTRDFVRHLSDHGLDDAWRRHFSEPPGASQFSEAAWRTLLAEFPLAPALLARLHAFLDAHRGHAFAVRSSGSWEDGSDLSFAGQYDTFLNRRGFADVVQSLHACWASLFNDRVRAYLCHHARSEGTEVAPAMGVVIQVMVDAAQSGVSFSVDPRTGRDTHVVTEAVRGLGEGLVSGIVAPDHYVVEWRSQTVVEARLAHCETKMVAIDLPPFVSQRPVSDDERREAVLDDAALQEITALCVRIQALFGFPVDVEWSRDDQGGLWLLQARPITSLHITCTDQQWTTADFRDGGVSSDVCTPLMWSLYDYIWEKAMPAYMAQVHLLPPHLPAAWGTVFFARPYWNVGAIKAALARLPGYVESEFDDDLGIARCYEGPGRTTRLSLGGLIHALRVLFALKRRFKAQLKFCAEFLPRQQQRLATLDALDDEPPKGVGHREFTDFYEALVTTGYDQSEGTYFTHIFNNTNLSTLFREQLNKLAPQVDYGSLVAGLDDVAHLRQTRDLWETVTAIQGHQHQDYWTRTPLAELLAAYRSGSNAYGLPRVRRHIRNFRHHSARELDLRVPRIDDDPTLIFESIRQLLAAGPVKSPEQVALEQKRKYQEARAQLGLALGGLARRRIFRMLDMMRSFLWWREELRDLSTRYYYHIRRWTVQIGRHWVADGRLQQEDDIFFLPVETILAELRQPESQPLSDLVAGNRLYYESFRNFQNPNEVAPNQCLAAVAELPAAGGVLTGIGGSPGVVTGTARVIHSIQESARIEAGDILVTHFTDPGWTVKFPLLKGVVTESGGMLSHAAVISREYGIPAVLAVSGATRQIRDGQTITLDGGSGRVIPGSQE